MMKNFNYHFYLLFLFVLFISLNAGLFSIFPISGLGFVSYMSLFIMIYYVTIENKFMLKKFSLPYIITFLWLLFLVIVKPQGTFNGLYTWFLGGLIFFSFFYIEENENFHFYFIFASFLLAFFFSLVEIFSGIHFPLSRFVKNNFSSVTHLGLHIPTYYFTNENDFCAFFTLLFCLLRTVRYSKRIFFDILFLPYIIFCLIISDAKICLIALFMYYTYIILMKINKKLRFFIYVVIFILFIFVFVNFIIPFIINLINLNSTKSIIIRINLVLLALDNIFNKNNFWGLGPGSFPSIVNNSNFNTGTIVDPHNWFIELGVEAGLIFLIFYIVFILKYFIIENNKCYRAFFVVFLICNFCSSRFTGILWNWFFLALFFKRLFYIKGIKK